jgi:hypothetical protein
VISEPSLWSLSSLEIPDSLELLESTFMQIVHCSVFTHWFTML